MRALAVALMLATACGRIGFQGRGDGATGDACAGPPAVVEQVASGLIVIAATEVTHSAPLSVPLDRSVLFTSLREAEPSPAYGATSCVLTAAGVECTRFTPGTDYAGSTGEIIVRFTVVVFASGVTVQRGTQDTTPPLVIAPVPLESSFVLLGGSPQNNGNSWGTNEYAREELMAQSLDVHDFDTSLASHYAWQVVTCDGARVERGTQALPAGTTTTSQALSTMSPRAFPVVSYTANSNVAIGAATSSLRARIGSAALVLDRDKGDMPLDASWEVITLPFATARGEITLATGQAQATVPVPGLHGASSVALASSQALYGQSGGSTNYAGAANDLPGEASVTLTSFDDSIVLERAVTDSDSVFDWVAIDFSQPICP